MHFKGMFGVNILGCSEAAGSDKMATQERKKGDILFLNPEERQQLDL